MKKCREGSQAHEDYQNRRQSPGVLEYGRSFMVMKTGAQVGRTLSCTRHKRDHLLAMKTLRHNNLHYHPLKLTQEVPWPLNKAEQQHSRSPVLPKEPSRDNGTLPNLQP